MAKLTLKFKENIIKDYRIEKGGALKIGRRDTNDVVIENLAVSSNHAKIDSVGDGYLLIDLQSKNGTFVNEKRITSHFLKAGDQIIIGKHTLGFDLEEGEAPATEAPAGAGGMDQTMVMDTDKQRELLARTVSDMGTEDGSTVPLGVLTYLKGGDAEVELTKKLTKIGKDAASDVVVSGLLVGKTAATISRRPRGYFLSYVGGVAKPKVNDQTVKESVELKEFDTIEIGPVKMQFIFKA